MTPEQIRQEAMTQLKPFDDLYAVPIPKGAKNVTLIQSHSYFNSPRLEHSIGGIDLPTNGNWHFAFADPLKPTEEEAREWVAYCRGYGFRNYLNDHYNGGSSPFNVLAAYHLKTGIESLHSRIRSEGFEHPERVVVLIKK